MNQSSFFQIPRWLKFQKSFYSKKKLNDRIIDSVPYPEIHKLQEDEVYTADGKPSILALSEHFSKEGRLEEEVARKIINDGAIIFHQEATLMELPAPVTFCGDIHGQYFDLLQIFEIGGMPPNTKYIFLGDYVDRGAWSIECILYLWAMKINHPNEFFLLRGNHECRNLTARFSFKKECEIKYSLTFYEDCMKAFDCLPLAAVVNKEFLCLHGGISPNIQTLDDIRNINRFREPPRSGPMCDILWADPVSDFEQASGYFSSNSARGCSFVFGQRAVRDFLERNKLISIIRAHEVQQSGCQIYQYRNGKGFPPVITIFSAPNYLDTYGNQGALMEYENRMINIKQFNSTPHPYCLPMFMDVFTWSLPFVGEQITEMLISVLNICTADELLADPENQIAATDLRKDIIRKKIRAVGKIMAAFRRSRERAELELKLKGLAPVPPNYEMSEDYQNALRNFQEGTVNFSTAKELDKFYEKYPD